MGTSGISRYKKISFSRSKAVLIAGAVGLTGGLVGHRVLTSLRLLLACCIALAALRIGFSAAGF
ncbi:hypothetical protein VU11_05480 [Desulfobulbus sp. US2]|nr:hypothetical protein [Desulfobulbus sp. US4]MCW5208097.1 hypothetical protein [Desulfobulbus sp. US2]WLE98719.1 MAG: hypothetical protein QTN59_07720 [Candidatus Electrothrix communis]